MLPARRRRAAPARPLSSSGSRRSTAPCLLVREGSGPPGMQQHGGAGPAAAACRSSRHAAYLRVLSSTARRPGQAVLQMAQHGAVWAAPEEAALLAGTVGWREAKRGAASGERAPAEGLPAAARAAGCRPAAAALPTCSLACRQEQGRQGRQGGQEEPVQEGAEAALQRGVPPPKDPCAQPRPQVPSQEVREGRCGGWRGGAKHSFRWEAGWQHWLQERRGRRRAVQRCCGSPRGRVSRPPACPAPRLLTMAPPVVVVPSSPLQRAWPAASGRPRGDQVPPDHRVRHEED